MDYITGRTNPIITDAIASYTDSVFTDFEFTSLFRVSSIRNDNTICCIWCTTRWDTAASPVLVTEKILSYNRSTKTNSAGLVYSRSSYSDSLINTKIDTVGRYKLSTFGAFILDEDGAVISRNGYSSLDDISPLKFFHFYYNNSYYSMDFVRLYRCTVVALDGTTTHDFLPCENPSGEEGLYDVVGRAFYGFSTT